MGADVAMAFARVTPARRWVPEGKTVRVAAILVLTALGLSLSVRRIEGADPWVLGSFALVGIGTTFGLAFANERDGIGLAVVFWFFHHVFFFMAPTAQYLSGTWNFREPGSLLMANGLSLMFISVFAATDLFTRWFTGEPERPRAGMSYVWSPGLLTIGAVTLVIFAGFVAVTGFDASGSVFTRALGFGPLARIIDFTVRPVAFFAAAFALVQVRHAKPRGALAWTAVSVALVAGLLLNLPTASARFYVFATYLAVAIILVPPTRWTRGIYLAGLAIAVPAASLANLARGVVGGTATAPTRPLLTEGTFDAYEIFAHGVGYFAREGVTYGHQLLGPLSFFVPRAWWPEKPTGTGAHLVQQYLIPGASAADSNVAAPLILEGYANFGALGIAMAALVCGIAFALMDRQYRAHQAWRAAAAASGRTGLPRHYMLFTVLYGVLVGMSLLLLRGDLLSTTGYVAAFVVAFLIARAVVVRTSVGRAG